MSIYLGYPSALEYLRAMALRPGFRSTLLDKCDLVSAVATVSAVREAGLIGGEESVELDKPVYLLLPGDHGKSSSRLVVSRTWSRPIPAKSLCCCGDSPDVVVSTPGFCLLQAASVLTFEDLVQLGLEMCGTYSSGARCTEKQYKLTPLTSKRSLEMYLTQVDEGKVVRRARKAVQYVVDYVGSPMEGVTYLLLCLPCRYGGFGLTGVLANGRIDLPAELRKYYDKPYVLPDLLWPRAKVVVEYDSDEFHTGGKRSSQDSGRRTLLMSMGYEIHVVNKAFLDDERAVERLARRIASKLSIRMGRETSGELERRQLLRTRLLDRSRDWKHERRSAGEADAARRS